MKYIALVFFIGTDSQKKRFFNEVYRITQATQIFGVLSWMTVYWLMPGPLDIPPALLIAALSGMLLGTCMTSLSKTLEMNIASGIVSVGFLSLGFRTLMSALDNPDFWVFPLGLIITLTSAPIFSGVVYYNLAAILTWVILSWDCFPVSDGGADDVWPLFTLAASLLLGSLMNFSFWLLRIKNYKIEMELQALAFKDPLTGMNNRRVFSQRAQALQKEPGGPLNFLMIDIDNFKRINDELGHDIGDEVLKMVAQAISKEAQEHLCARLGGEEFAVIYMGGRTAACGFAQAILNEIQAIVLPDRSVSVSIGIARLSKSADLSCSYKLADEQLYLAKKNGKNQYAVSGDLTELADGLQ